MKDPVAGYTDSLLGIMGIGVGIGLGVMKVSNSVDGVYVDMVPADIVINYILIVAWFVTNKEANDKQHVYLCCAGEVHRITNSKFEKFQGRSR